MSDLGPILLLGLLSAFLLYAAKRKGFFALPLRSWHTPVKLVQVIGAFAIYFFLSSFAASLIVSILRGTLITNYVAYLSWLNFGVSFGVFLILALYWRFLPEPTRWGLLRRGQETHSLSQDFYQALYSWIIAFPLVLTVSQILETLLSKVFHVSHLPDQVAVRFLKSTFENPLYFVLAALSIVILAPLIEETLFRGFLQSYIRRHLGPKQAILITSACFSLFHYAAGQGIGNISIICSLFVLALFLGFIYEKQGTLRASMFLHGLFNAVSVVNLYLFGGFTTL